MLQPPPFNWTATADSILEKLQRLCSQISGTGHERPALDGSVLRPGEAVAPSCPGPDFGGHLQSTHPSDPTPSCRSGSDSVRGTAPSTAQPGAGAIWSFSFTRR
jgi:hypothetical protein